MDLTPQILLSLTFITVATYGVEVQWVTLEENLVKDGKDWEKIQPRNQPKDFNIDSNVYDLLRIVGGELVDFNSDNLNYEQIDWDNILVRFTDISNLNKTSNASQENNQRIYGGEIAKPHSVPYQAALIVATPQGQFFCGASLISLTYVLTAAHCLEGATEVEIILGAHNVQEIEPTQQRYLSTIFKIHEEYNNINLANDIGIVELPINATINENVQIAQLQTERSKLLSNLFGIATISGWGKVSSNGNLSPELKVGYLTIIPNILCLLTFPSTSMTGNVCTFGYFHTSGCNGDSGGPLVLNNKQVGIVSFGARWCDLGFPTVFTRVAAHGKWIQSNTDVVL